VGLNLDKHWDLTRSKLLIYYIIIPYANVIRAQYLIGWIVGFNVEAILGENGVDFGPK
jgi:hypothetical protein